MLLSKLDKEEERGNLSAWLIVIAKPKLRLALVVISLSAHRYKE